RLSVYPPTLFFFSSRRRHTRFSRDWSSDVCSSDLAELNKDLTIPLIASGGAGNIQHFVDVFKKCNVDAALAASVFHYGEISIPELKQELIDNGLQIRN